MQQIERENLTLDDSSIIERLLPDLTSKPILTGFTTSADGKQLPKTHPRTNPITLRMLLTNTAGLAYSIFHPLLWHFIAHDPSRIDTSDWATLAAEPLIAEPGIRFEYGAGIDWAGVLLERLTGQTLHEYLTVEVFAPLGLRNTLFAPHMEARHLAQLVPPYTRLGDGSVVPLPRPPPPRERVTDVEKRVHAKYTGAGNMMSSAPDYAELLAALLNGGTSARTGKAILKPETVRMMFAPSLPEHVSKVNARIESSGPDMPLATVFGGGEFSDGDEKVTWGLAGALQGSDRVGGRRKGTGYWMGIFGTEWWVDFEIGVGIVVFGNSLPFLDPVWKGFVGEVERAIYAGLKVEA